MDKIEKEGKELIDELFKLLGVSATTNVKGSGSEEKVLEIEVTDTDAAGLIIGSQGQTLNAIQSFLGMALKNSTGEFVRIVIDVDGWRDKQEDYLKGLADQAALRAEETGEAQNLYNLTPAQRRTIHMYLSEKSSIVTESMGEGDSRYLVVKVKSE